MKKRLPLLICFVLLLHCFSSFAQKRFFIYIQAENHQQFYAVINNKTYSSSISGYMVIPKLRSGKQFFTVGFVKQESPEQKFICTISSKDLGFSLKTFGEKGWGLFNLQDFSTIMSNPKDWDVAKAENDKIPVEEEPDTDVSAAGYGEEKPAIIQTKQAFDENVKPGNTTVEVKQEQKQDIIKHEEKKVEVKQEEKRPKVDKIKEDNRKKEPNVAVIPPVVTPTTSISKSAENNTKEVNNQTSQQEEKKQVPAPKNKTEASNIYSSTSSAKASKRSIIKNYEQTISAGVDLVYIDYTEPQTDTVNVFIPYGFQPQIKNVLYNSGCVQLATEFDYNKLRRSMAEQTADNKMIDAAKKAFKSRCYTSEQIKNLSLLFVSDAGRYNFYSAAYPSAYDLVNYSALEQNLRSDEFKQKFRLFLGY